MRSDQIPLPAPANAANFYQSKLSTNAAVVKVSTVQVLHRDQTGALPEANTSGIFRCWVAAFLERRQARRNFARRQSRPLQTLNGKRPV
ncbi:MAG: hypothetical protein COT74_12075 [Bdellovibrionales bacterium CG10_big_fil_rev_8_21_14_0_10_45_34]|nr:MAG: hypothetical protein COT74_12075 [Bdellovibrionales bacterium CG10_big_fil_rev_8_21_14_0_10_45_34]